MSYSNKSSAFTAALVVVVMLAVAIMVTEGQSPPPSTCAEKLIPCAGFINSTMKPPDTCCGPLKEAVTQQRECLCNLYSTPGLLPSLGINVTEALLLPGRCGIPADLSACTQGVPGNYCNSLRGIAWTGLTALFLFWSSMIFY